LFGIAIEKAIAVFEAGRIRNSEKPDSQNFEF